MAAVRSIDSAPIVALIRERFDTDEDAAAALNMSVAAIRAWRHRPRMNIWTADRLCVQLQRHPITVFGRAWLEIPDGDARKRNASHPRKETTMPNDDIDDVDAHTIECRCDECDPDLARELRIDMLRDLMEAS